MKAEPDTPVASTDATGGRTIPFNVNHYVRVRLTAEGLKILRANHERTMGPLASKYPFTDPTPDADGWTRFQAWDLMHEFGARVFNGCRVPFETGILIEVDHPHVPQPDDEGSREAHPIAVSPVVRERIAELEKRLAETSDCLEDVASGKGGWSWEEVVQDARAALEVKP